MAILHSEQQQDPESLDSTAVETMEKIETINRSAREIVANESRYHAKIFRDREELSRYTHLARMAASLLVSQLENDPVDLLRRFDLQQLVLWHVERSLHSFWHTTANGSPRNVGQIIARRDYSDASSRPFFDKAASDHLNFARQICEAAPSNVEDQIVQLEDLHAMRMRASREGLNIVAASRPVVDSSENLNANVTILPAGRGGFFPTGKAALYAVDSSGRINSDPPWRNLEMPPQESGQERKTMLRKVRDKNLKAVVFFRGREYRREFRANSFRGAVVEYSPPVYDRQSVTLHGDEPSPPTVVFILDCSYTMIEDVETPEGKQTRLQIAAAELKNMLGALLERDASRPRIGVRFFGHRVGWYLNSPTGRRKFNRYFKPKDDLHPGADVEVVVTLGEFDPRQSGRVSDALDAAEPLGVTPVNLAIMEAFDDFKHESPDAAKSIIVITDGKNDQSHNGASPLRKVTPTTTQQVIRKWTQLDKDRKVAVHIVGFGIPSDEERDAIEEFQKIAVETEGSVVTTDSGAELVEELRKRLDINGYEVLGPNQRPVVSDANTGESKRIELNTEVSIPGGPGHYTFPGEFEILYQDVNKRVPVEGGEAIDLQVVGNGVDIDAIPYSSDYRSNYPIQAASARLLPGPRSRDDRNLLMRLHPPERRTNQVEFRISMQEQSLHYTLRPREIWVEVIPEGEEQAYLFYDPFFEPLTPVPVVAFTASNWPKGVDQARVRFWCSYNDTPPVLPIPLAEERQREAKATQFRDVPQVPGVQAQVRLESLGRDGIRVLVDERANGPDASVGAIRVWLDSTDEALQPTSISRQIDAANHLGQHVFVFPQMNEREFADRITVQIASAKKIKENALQLKDARGVVVDIVDYDDSHVPTGVGAGRF